MCDYTLRSTLAPSSYTFCLWLLVAGCTTAALLTVRTPLAAFPLTWESPYFPTWTLSPWPGPLRCAGKPGHSRGCEVLQDIDQGTETCGDGVETVETWTVRQPVTLEKQWKEAQWWQYEQMVSSNRILLRRDRLTMLTKLHKISLICLPY